LAQATQAKEEGRAYIGNLDVAAQLAKEHLIKGTIAKVIDWATAFSLWPVHLMTSCCGCEIGAAWGPRFDNERYGSLPWVGPRQTNLIIIEGTVTKKMACTVRLTWEQMPYPKFVIAMGACALDGGIFYNSYNIVRPWQVVPVDLYIPGCPPRPEAVAIPLVIKPGTPRCAYLATAAASHKVDGPEAEGRGPINDLGYGPLYQVLLSQLRRYIKVTYVGAAFLLSLSGLCQGLHPPLRDPLRHVGPVGEERGQDRHKYEVKEEQVTAVVP